MTAKDYLMLNSRRSKTACFCGGISDGYEMYKTVDNTVLQGYEMFLFCAENLSGLEFAKQVLLRKKKQTGNKPDKILIVAVVSDERYTDDKAEYFRETFFSVVSECDCFVDLKSADPLSCEKFMISKSSMII